MLLPAVLLLCGAFLFTNFAHADPAPTDTLSTHEVAPGLILHFVSEPFDPAAHEVAEYYAAIDGCPVYGTDGGQPAYALARAYVTLHGQRLDLDASCFYQNWPFDATNAHAEPLGGGTYALHSRFSDGAGTFEATWRVTPHATVRTRLQSGPDLMQRERAQGACYDQLSGSILEMVELLDALIVQQSSEAPPARVDAQTLEAMAEALDALDRAATEPPCTP